MLEAAPPAGVIGALQALMTRADSLKTLETIDVPTLILVGDEDVLTPPSVAKTMADAIRGASLHIIAGSGHLTNIERPAAVNHLLSEFLSSLSLS
jgi:pimeloyl-ACP methyl ester carboxylesterase